MDRSPGATARLAVSRRFTSRPIEGTRRIPTDPASRCDACSSSGQGHLTPDCGEVALSRKGRQAAEGIRSWSGGMTLMSSGWRLGRALVCAGLGDDARIRHRSGASEGRDDGKRPPLNQAPLASIDWGTPDSRVITQDSVVKAMHQQSLSWHQREVSLRELDNVVVAPLLLGRVPCRDNCNVATEHLD